jgi:magnesium-transporting ATPase (P-type)
VYRLARRKALVRELPTVETLARVDVLCLDKTGTLTEGDIVAEVVEPLVRGDGIEAALGALAAADPLPNATMRAIAARFPAPSWRVENRLAFSSSRGFSAATFSDHGTWLLGAPEVLLSATAAIELRDRIDEHGMQGRRVLLLARGHASAGLDAPREGSEPVALLGMSDRVRPMAADTLRFFADQRVAVKVISGDNPVTVAALARRAGVQGDGMALDATTLPVEPAALADQAMAATVFGRVSPDQKLAIVSALHGRGQVVAMIGDGVNDVLALKQADVGVAMGAGTPAAQAVAQLVLLDNDFSTLPAAVAEGRRVIGNIERVAKLFVTKSVYALLLALAIGVAGWPFPFLPRHLSLIAALTIGLPGLLLALGSTTERARPGFVTRVLTAAVPAGVLAALATLIGYGVARVQFDVSTAEAQTSATIVLLAVGLVVLGRFAAPLTPARRTMIAAMWVLFVAVLAAPGTRAFFALDLPSAIVWLSALGLVSVVDRLLHARPDPVVRVTSGLKRRWSELRRHATASPGSADAGSRPDRDVYALIATGERQTVERKSSLRWDRREGRVNPELEKAVAKTIAGFANSSRGGTLLLGVDDVGHVVGLAEDYRSLRDPGRDSFELHLTQTLTKYLGTPAMSGTNVTFERVGGQDVALVSVAPATQPVYTTEGANVAFHLRTGNSTRPLNVRETMDYASTRWPPAPPRRRMPSW